jgi:hypothetical protein
MIYTTIKSMSLAALLCLSSGAIAIQGDLPPSELCPEPTPCYPNGTHQPPVGSGCALITIEPLVSYLGYGSDGCTPTCRVCKQDIKITIDCTSCTNGCTYIWENHSYDASGNANTPQITTGTSTGKTTVRTTLASNCDGETAITGASAGGVLKTYTLHCDCQ